MKKSYGDFIDNEIELPYYSERFSDLITMLKNPEGQNCAVDTEAQLSCLREGIKYYYNVIKELDDESAKCDACKVLVESINRALYCIFNNENSQQNDTSLKKQLCAYQEYLQSISNSFMNQKVKSSKECLIFKFSLALIENKVKMDTLFSEIYKMSVKKESPSLCIVFSPSEQLKNVYKYLPMLTHEVSHHFLYAPRKERNEFVLKYLLDNISVNIVEAMLQEISDNYTNILYGEATQILAKNVSQVLYDDFEKNFPGFLENGHLLELKDNLYEYFRKIVNKQERTKGIYDMGQSFFDILKESFVGLSAMTDMKWYVIDKEKEYSVENFFLSVFFDIMCNADCENIKQYSSQLLHTNGEKNIDKKIYIEEIDKLLKYNCKKSEENCVFIPKSSVMLALKLLMPQIAAYQKANFAYLRHKGLRNDCVPKILSSLCNDYSLFVSDLKAAFKEEVKPEFEQDFFAFFDVCVAAKNYINNIQYVYEEAQELIQKKKQQYAEIKNIYINLNESVRQILGQKGKNASEEKLFFSSSDINAVLIKLGLLHDVEDANKFTQIFLKIFNNWDINRFEGIMGEYLKLYCEVFADLSMCCAFRFNQIGYFNYMVERFSYETEASNYIERNMTLERVRLVLTALSSFSAMDEDYHAMIFRNHNEKDMSKIRWRKMLINCFKSKEGNKEHDQHFCYVYSKMNQEVQWFKNCQENAVIQEIGKYYNQGCQSEWNDNLNNAFFEEFFSKYEKRCEEYGNEHNDPIEIMLKEVK